jgi:hypothetical protein
MVDVGAPSVRATASTRQTTGFVESLLRLVGLDWAVPDFSTLSRRQETLAVTIPYRGSKGPPNLLIDKAALPATGPRAAPNGTNAEAASRRRCTA